MSFAANVGQGRTQSYSRGNAREARHQAFHHSRTSLGATGHWIHVAAVAAPLVIGEVVKDPEKRWRALRLTSVAAALASEAVWTHRLSKDRHRDEETREALRDCPERAR